MPLPLNTSVIDDILGPTPTATPRPKPRPSTSKPSKLASSTTSKPQTQHQQPSAAASASPHRHADLSVGSTRDDPIILSPELSPVPLPPPEEPISLSRAMDDSGVTLPGLAEVRKTSGSPEDDARPNNTSLNASGNTHLPTAEELVAGQSSIDASATATSQGQPERSGNASGPAGGARSAGEATSHLAQTFSPPPRPSQPASGGSGGDDHHDGRVSQLPTAGRELDRSSCSTAAQPVVPEVSHGTAAPSSSSSSSSIPASAQPSQPTFYAQPHSASGRYSGAGEARAPSTTTVPQLAGTSNAADEGGQRFPPTRPSPATQLPQALTDTTMGDISAAPAALPQSLTGRVAGDDLPTLAPPSTRSSPLSDESASDYEEETCAVATTPAGVPLWTTSEDNVLLSTIQRVGTQWKAVESDYNKHSSGTYRSIRALRHRWNHLREGKSTPQLTAAKRAAKATPRARQDNGWTEYENQVLLQGLAEGKAFAAIYSDFKRKFRRSKRTRGAVRARFYRLQETGQAGGLEDDGEEEKEEDGSDGASQEEEGDVEVGEDVEMADLPTTSEPRLTHAGQYVWTDEDDEVLLASVARYRTQCIDWPRVEKRYNRHCAIQRSRPALQARWHTIKHKQSRQGQQDGVQQRPPGKGRGGEGGSSAPRSSSRHQVSSVGPQTQDSQASLVGSLEHSSISAFPPTAAQHQHVAPSGPQLSSFPLHTAAGPQQPQTSHSILDTLSLSVDYEPNGVRISNVIPGLEVKVFSRKSVKVSLPESSSFTTSPSSSFEEQPAFHLKVLHDGSVQAVRSPPGASLGAGLARKEDGGMGTVARCVGVDGFSVSLSS